MAVIDILLLVAALSASPRVVDRVVWETDQNLPPKTPEKVRLRVIAYTLDGLVTATKMVHVSDLHDTRTPTVVHEVPGEELTDASTMDMNDDGVREVLLVFSPPRNQSLRRLLVFCFSGKDRKYYKIFEEGPASGLKAKWVRLTAEKDDRRNGLAIERMPEGATSSAETTTYALTAEQLIVYSKTQAPPSTPADQLAWGLRWTRRGDLKRARPALEAAAGALEGDDRARALHALARVHLAAADLAAAARTLGELATSPPAPPWTDDAERLAGWLEHSTSPALVGELMLAQLALDDGRHKEALAHAQKIVDDRKPPAPGQTAPQLSPLTDEALLIQAQVYLNAGQQREAVRLLRALVLACPNSPHLGLAQKWLGELTGASTLAQPGTR